MNTLKLTLRDLDKSLTKNSIKFLLTRFNPVSVSDLDLLVNAKDFSKAIFFLNKLGYKTQSHDQALGGRISGMQINLVKKSRVKIDLHQDFTWRRSRYIDTDFLWKDLTKKNIYGEVVNVPKHENDIFLIMTNIIFEKEYLSREDYKHIKKSSVKLFYDNEVHTQVVKHGWQRTFSEFSSWFSQIKTNSKFPIFLPVKLILSSYYEKWSHNRDIDFVSLAYYLFFKIRYILLKKLPY